MRKLVQEFTQQWDLKLKVFNPLISTDDDFYDAVFALDVLEHIPEDMENVFLRNMFCSLNENGVAIIGMPSLESQPYASYQSKQGHINCKSSPDLKN